MGVMDAALFDLASEWSAGYDNKNDPVAWVQKNGEFPWSKQREILSSVKDNRYTAVHSAHDMGKSFIASRIIAWWIDSHPPGEAFVVSTAPTAAQVAAIMWREVTKIHKKAKLSGKINRAGYPQWFLDGELVGYGRKPADYEDSAFQGIHAKYVLVVVDEACGVAKNLFDAVDALATNEHARVLAIGNPDDPASHFSSVCKPDQGWNTIHLDGLRSPNMTYDRIIGDDPENPRFPLLKALMEAENIPFSTEVVPDEVRPMLIDCLWVEERIQRWAGVPTSSATALSPEELQELVRTRCEGSSLFTAKVRGMFPTSASEGVIPLGWIQRAVDRWHDAMDNRQHIPASQKAAVPGPRTLGVDVARTGNDQTCVATRYGSLVEKLKRYRLTDTMEVADAVAVDMGEPGSAAVVDVIGIGAGVYDALRRMKNEGRIVGTPYQFNASANSNRRDKLNQFHFFNDRAAMWWQFREALDPSQAGGSKVALPDDEELIEELAAPKYELYANGKLKIESKDDIKRKIGRSTDSADAVLQSFWLKPAQVQDAIPYAEAMAAERRGASFDYGFEGFSVGDINAKAGFGSMVPASSMVDWDEWDSKW